MTSPNIAFPLMRENIRNNTKTAFLIGAKAVASVLSATAEKTVQLVKRYPRMVATGGAVTALSGLISAANEVGKLGVTVAHATSTRLYEAIAETDTTQAIDVYNSPTSGLASLGLLAAGAAIATLGFQKASKTERNEVITEVATQTTPQEDIHEVATVMSQAGIERVYDCSYQTWQEDTFSQPYRPTWTDRFDAWAENKWSQFRAWRQTVREAHAYQTRPDQPYNPFPQTTNYIGEPLLPG